VRTWASGCTCWHSCSLRERHQQRRVQRLPMNRNAGRRGRKKRHRRCRRATVSLRRRSARSSRSNVGFAICLGDLDRENINCGDALKSLRHSSFFPFHSRPQRAGRVYPKLPILRLISLIGDCVAVLAPASEVSQAPRCALSSRFPWE
jgi:hypothetical protein